MIFYIGAAASYGFDERGERFHLREYRVADRLTWLRSDEIGFEDWCNDHRISVQPDNSYRETGATAECPACKSHLWADVIYREMTIESFGNVRIRPPFRPTTPVGGGSPT